MDIPIFLPKPHDRQIQFLNSRAKRKVIRAGRRGGKTVGAGMMAVEAMLQGLHVLYAAPTQEQVEAFWNVCRLACEKAIEAGVVQKHETYHLLTRGQKGDAARIRAKTAWDADSLRGDYADLLILDEFQLMNEEAWERVGAPMMLDNDGTAIFIYTPPSIFSRSRTKARDSKHAAKLYKKAEQRMLQGNPRWEVFTFTSHDNPYLSEIALDEITEDMSPLAYRQEIEAEDIDQDPRALWSWDSIEQNRITPDSLPELVKIGIGVDPSGGAAEIGIVAAGVDAQGHAYVLNDFSLLGSPNTWGTRVVTAYEELKADYVYGEQNFGGDMVEGTIRAVEGGEDVAYQNANATRGKAVRAAPISSKYVRGLVHHVGSFPKLEDELCSWVPDTGMRSPNRLDALVWVLHKLTVKKTPDGALVY